MSVETQQPHVSPVQETDAVASQGYLRASPTPRSDRVNGAIVFVIAAGLIAAVGMLYLLQTNHVASLGYEMSQLQQVREDQAVGIQQLTAELAGYQELSEVERVAREEMGMRPVHEFDFLTLQVPAETELALPEPVVEEERSLLDRFWRRVTGKGEAVNSDPVESTP